MKSFTNLTNNYTDKSQNTATTNVTRGQELINDRHRYLLQKYFNNENTYIVTTIGSQSLTATGSITAGAVSATLTAPWAYQTVQCFVTFSDGELRTVNFTSGSTAITWQGALNDTVTSALAVGGVQFYPLPPNYSKLKTITITIGDLKWTPDEIFTREQWDKLNVFPYYADIPKNFFIYNGQLGIWPIPSTTGNVLTFNYKIRVPDLSLADYTTSTVTATNGSTVITGSATSWLTAFSPTAGSVINQSLWIRLTAPSGDGNWYQISTIDSATQLTLLQAYTGATIAGCAYTIGQMPIILEDFHDLLYFYPLVEYYTAISKDMEKAQEFKALYNEGLELLNEYSGKKTFNVNLRQQINLNNPNSYPQSIGGNP